MAAEIWFYYMFIFRISLTYLQSYEGRIVLLCISVSRYYNIIEQHHNYSYEHINYKATMAVINLLTQLWVFLSKLISYFLSGDYAKGPHLRRSIHRA